MMYLDRRKQLKEKKLGQIISIVRQKIDIQRSNDLQGMDNTRNVTQYCQEDVDEEVGIATALEEDTERRENDGEDNLADIATRQVSHETHVQLDGHSGQGERR